ncbi:hypothetical protein JR316_0010857 [Psilocybe cubensis]|uniref:Uncharacterized protein n=2 Tax=Psilocybe cubensis TaxID=181762 RepID=A0A8H7XU86_PSICU|nr:hypothetical protein JR316_0010857 [Psilocybe cubensis]KAH9476941.1 hypothetical protein JR316_0010857 [Psilocybe cubensis]
MEDYKIYSGTSMARFAPRRRVVMGIIAGLILFLPIWRFEVLQETIPPSIQASVDRFNFMKNKSPQIRNNIAIASSFGFHFDVYLAVAWTLQRVMRQGSVQLYTPTPYYFDFQTIIDKYDLYRGSVKDYEDLSKDIMDNSVNGGFDLVILGTCEIDMRNWNNDLLKAWDARDAQHKFQLVCIVHNALDDGWHGYISEWSRRNAIRVLTISEHVARSFRSKFQNNARSADPALKLAALEYIPVDFHIPILDLQHFPELSPTRMLSNAVIQGSFDSNRRDYTRIFSELNASLHANPEVWGYLPFGNGPSFIQNKRSNDPAFKLHLVGSGWITVPDELKNLIVFHTNLNYTDFYEVMGGMDICIPAFLSEDDINFKYQASSSIAMCMESNVPILALEQLRNAYTHVDDDRITITRPAIMSEIEAVKALRTGDATEFLAETGPISNFAALSLGSHPKVLHAVKKLVKGGWVRSKRNFEICKRETWKRNEEVIYRLLRDL